VSARALGVVVFTLLAGCAGDHALPYGSTAVACGNCHVDHFDEWYTSPHAKSASSPVFMALLPEVEDAWGSFARTTCEGCHSPGHGGDGVIGCVSCHAAVGNHAERDAMLDVDPTQPIAGPFDDADPTPAHATRRGGFLASESLCGTCHEVTGPSLVLEPTLSEFRASPAATNGRTCIDCHLPHEGERTLTPDSSRLRPVRPHLFVGMDPAWGADADRAAESARRTLELLRTALALRADWLPGGGVDVAVQSLVEGHHVPTGATFLRDIWVDVEVDGAIVRSRVLCIGDQPMRDGAPVALLTRADSVAVGSLAPGAEARAPVALEDVAAPAVDVVLRARAVRDEILVALGVPELSSEIPTHEIARVHLTR